MRVACLVFLSFCAFPLAARELPDVAMTPGKAASAVTSENLDETICVPGYTKTIRPPVSYTNKLKRQQIVKYHYTDKNPKHYEEDHCIPLTLGGDPKDPKNLWPQPYAGPWGARKKDRLEVRLNRMVCRGDISLEDAQQAICSPTGNWIDAYKKYVEQGTISR